MITKQDILDRAAEWQLRPDVVEKDYVLGWLLAALSQHPETSTQWVFKGGTCLKKCYFETYRFSEDLDFTLLPTAKYHETDLRSILQEIARQASEQSGIQFPVDQVVVRSRQDKLGRPTFRAGLVYRGPMAVPTGPRILFDLTQNEPVVDASVARSIHHPYSDTLGVSTVRAYSLEELFAEKTRALFERTRPRDLYDVVYILENQPSALNLAHAREIFQVKCHAKTLEPPTSSALLDLIRDSDELRAEWANMLGHQLPQLPPIDGVLDRLAPLLGWIDILGPAPVSTLSSAPYRAGEVLVAPAGTTYWGGGLPLEAVRFAGANRLLVEFMYHGRRRLVEPYSLRQAATGNLLLYGWEQGSTHIKAFNTAEMGSVRTTTTTFTPRYRVEFSPSGAMTVLPSAVPERHERWSPTGSRRTQRRNPTASFGPTYIFQCPYCQKEFRRKENNSSLQAHKRQGGYGNCLGRRGYLIRTTY